MKISFDGNVENVLGEIKEFMTMLGDTSHINVPVEDPGYTKAVEDLKSNMRIVGAMEYAVLFYRDKLPKFNNGRQVDENGKNIRGTGKMIKNWFNWELDSKNEVKKIHPTQKPTKILKQLIEIFTDKGDTVIDPCCGSGTTLRASKELGRNSYGFEIKKEIYVKAIEYMVSYEPSQMKMFKEA